MASETLPVKYLRAGEEYLAALKTLGLHPELLGWGTDVSTKQWQLIMMTSIVEVGGPLALNRLLFSAYNMGATPKEISPFIIHVIGDRSLYASELRQLLQFHQGDKKLRRVDKYTNQAVGEPIQAISMSKTIGGFKIESHNLYTVHLRKQGYEQKTREWMRFKRNVEKLAA